VILSQTAVYALRATLCLGESTSVGPVRVDDIAERLDVPRNYLSKILHVLAKGGVLTSTRGPGGGFRLARHAEDLKLSEIVGHFDDLPGESGCLLGRDECSDDDPCAAHDHWKDVSGSVRRFFTETSLADLLRDRSLAEVHGTG
jgi:Rrf2 family iron-sulfur cluster assembly transcriptional regulator